MLHHAGPFSLPPLGRRKFLLEGRIGHEGGTNVRGHHHDGGAGIGSPRHLTSWC